METLQIQNPQLIKRLQVLSTQENCSIEAILETLLDQYNSRSKAIFDMEGMFDDDVIRPFNFNTRDNDPILPRPQ